MKLKRINKNKKIAYKLKNRTKFISFMVLLALLVYSCAIPIVSSGAIKQKIVSIYVNSGDTLWDIAMRYKPNSDVRSTIYDIKEYNGLKSYEITAGTYIYIPL